MKLRRIKVLAEKLLRAENCGDNAEVSILLTDDRNISELNRNYRRTEGPTDVLSFSQLEGDQALDSTSEIGEKVLGDVVISVQSARRQADEQGHSLDDEIDILLLHGLLHLLGYDHAKPNQASKMFARQAEILGSQECRTRGSG